MYEQLKIELNKLLNYLDISQDSVYASKTVEELKLFLTESINKINSEHTLEIDKIKFLIAPTGSLQDTSIDNGWGEEFVIIADKIERYINTA